MTTHKRALTVLILAAVAIAAVGGFGMLAGAQESDAADGTATVTFENQTSDGTTVTVASAETSEGGFMAMHTAALLDGAVLDSTLGQAQIESGQVSDVEVPLFNVPGQTAFGDQSALQEDQTLIAMPHRDTNDNGNYDFITSNGSEDGPYTANGSAVVDPAFVTLESEDGGDGAADSSDGKAKDTATAADGGDGKAKQQDGGDGAADGGDGAGGKAKQGGDGGADGAAGGNGKAKADGGAGPADTAQQQDGGDGQAQEQDGQAQEQDGQAQEQDGQAQEQDGGDGDAGGKAKDTDTAQDGGAGGAGDGGDTDAPEDTAAPEDTPADTDAPDDEGPADEEPEVCELPQQQQQQQQQQSTGSITVEGDQVIVEGDRFTNEQIAEAINTIVNANNNTNVNANNNTNINNISVVVRDDDDDGAATTTAAGDGGTATPTDAESPTMTDGGGGGGAGDGEFVDLELNKTGNESVVLSGTNTTVEYEITVTNNGTQNATGVVVEDPSIKTNLTTSGATQILFLSDNETEGEYDEVTGQWVDIGPLEPGETETLQIVAAVVAVNEDADNFAEVIQSDQDDTDGAIGDGRPDDDDNEELFTINTTTSF